MAKGYLGVKFANFLNLHNFNIYRLSRFSNWILIKSKKYTLIIATVDLMENK